MHFHIKPLRQNGTTFKTFVTFHTDVEINDHQIPVNISTVIDGDKDPTQIKDALVKALAKGIVPSTRHERLLTQTTVHAGDLLFKVETQPVCRMTRILTPAWHDFETALPSAKFTYEVDWMEHWTDDGVAYWRYLADFGITYSEEHDFFDVLHAILVNLVDAERGGNRLTVQSDTCGDIDIMLDESSLSITDIAEALYPIYQGE